MGFDVTVYLEGGGGYFNKLLEFVLKSDLYCIEIMRFVSSKIFGTFCMIWENTGCSNYFVFRVC